MKKLLTFVLSMIFGISVFMSGMMTASTYAMEVNDSAVFLTQAGSETCTLCSATMMLRRRAIIDGNENWEAITESSVSGSAWTWEGLLWDFSYEGMHVSRAEFSGSHEERVTNLQTLIDEHPEGIALYNGDSPHAVLVTGYEGEEFICVDPVNGSEAGEINLNDSYTVTVDSATSYWYIDN